MIRRIYIARPRLDCSFKPGPVPSVEGEPKNRALALFGTFLDNLEIYHKSIGHEVVVDNRPLWHFELSEMQTYAEEFDLLYFAHRLKRQFPIGNCARYFKTTPFPEYVTVDKNGWGASLSWLPVEPVVSDEALRFFDELRQRAASNISLFDQPSLNISVGVRDYLLFVCQLPHDETIRFHSPVSVEDALATVISYAERIGKPLVVKGHPANPMSMAPLKALTETCPLAYWVDGVSIHACLAGAQRVFMVNSGVGFEAMLHDKTIIHFGLAEYSSVLPQAECSVQALVDLEDYRHSSATYAGFLYSFFQQTIKNDDLESFGRILGSIFE